MAAGNPEVNPFSFSQKPACLLLPLAAQRTEEAFAGASCTSVQRSRDTLRLSLVNQACSAFDLTGPHYNALAFSGGLLTSEWRGGYLENVFQIPKKPGS